MQRPLTQQAHTALDSRLEPGALTIDATVGNGHDTCFLASRVGPNGHVLGFDVQADALETTRARLADADMLERCTLLLRGHEHMRQWVPAAWLGAVAAITFNLGYLPGSDKARITRESTTMTALEQALDLLRPGGLLSVLAYRGHPGGAAEAAAVEDWANTLRAGFDLITQNSPGPVLYLIERSR